MFRLESIMFFLLLHLNDCTRPVQIGLIAYVSLAIINHTPQKPTTHMQDWSR